MSTEVHGFHGFSVSEIRTKSKTAPHTRKPKRFFDTNETSDKIQFALHTFESNFREILRSYRDEYGNVNINQEIFTLMKKVSEDEKQRQIQIQQSKQDQETSTENKTPQSGSVTLTEAISENSQIQEIFNQKVLNSPMYFFKGLEITMKNNKNTLEKAVVDVRDALKRITYNESHSNFLRQLNQFKMRNEVSTKENDNKANEMTSLIDAYLNLSLPRTSSAGQIKTPQLELFMTILLNNSESILQSFEEEEARLNYAHKLIQIFEILIEDIKSPLRIDEFKLFLKCCQIRHHYDLKISYVVSILTKLEQVLQYTEMRYIGAVSDSLMANAETTSIEEAQRWSVYVNGLDNGIKSIQKPKCDYIILKILESDPQSALNTSYPNLT
ncbi:unnamed protein product [Ambrosiozyma monospora]|uniref:Unnamed protein product n=1 Tax=Ambrosiozyma monospora TaxID=43982 RepID=A0ACB5T761_AMBMO|nr:unnamed protein product [Ambrosiozyma monospora]